MAFYLHVFVTCLSPHCTLGFGSLTALQLSMLERGADPLPGHKCPLLSVDGTLCRILYMCHLEARLTPWQLFYYKATHDMQDFKSLIQPGTH